MFKIIKEVANCLDKYSPYANISYAYYTKGGVLHHPSDIQMDDIINICNDDYNINEFLINKLTIYEREIKMAIKHNSPIIETYVGTFDTIKKMGLNPIGSLNDAEDEIMISYDLFKEYGSTLIEQPVVVKDYDSCLEYIGKEIEYSHGKYKISGFYNPINSLRAKYIDETPDSIGDLESSVDNVIQRYSVIINWKGYNNYVEYATSNNQTISKYYDLYFPCDRNLYLDLMKGNCFNFHDICYDKPR